MNFFPLVSFTISNRLFRRLCSLHEFFSLVSFTISNRLFRRLRSLCIWTIIFSLKYMEHLLGVEYMRRSMQQ